MTDQLKFNVEDLKTQAGKLREVETSLREQAEALTKNLADLKRDWQSEAGTAFFSKYDSTWVKDIDKQCRLIERLALQIDDAAMRYGQVEDEFSRVGLG